MKKMVIKMPGIGTRSTISSRDFRNLITLLFGRHGDIEVGYFNERRERTSVDDMFLFYLKIPESKARKLFSEEEFEDLQDDGKLHVATWQDGKGWIVDYSMTRKLLIWAAIASERRALEKERRASPGRASEQRRLHLWMHEQSLRRLYRQALATLTFVGRFLGYVQPDPERPRRRRRST